MLRALSQSNPRNRWEAANREYDLGERPRTALQVFEDDSRSVVASNDSPDVPFRYSLNPYRGCAHGCAYCYARPSHEYLGFGSGTDFERKLVAKPRAAELLRAHFEKPSWAGELLVLSGVTDCYQPLEAELELTRQCLEVCAEYRNPVHIITKSALIERDIELLTRLHERASVGVSVSVTFWDAAAARAIEPYAPAPRRRIETIRRLTAAGIPVLLHIAPLIPGLADRDVIPILEAAREAGARSAIYTQLRLPGSVAEVFEQRLREAFPERAEKVLSRIREMRGGRLNDSRFHERMRGEGEYAASVDAMFRATLRRLGYEKFREPRTGTFQRPSQAKQLDLFGSSLAERRHP
ncbi:MAG: PA0069 family radical SAM protein [Polyangiaceae bacterium]